MATAAQVLANRANSQRSTGPRTEAGKQRSSSNSFRHGLTSSKIVLPGEDPAGYDTFRADILAEYQPANSIEQIVAEELCASGWRLHRARAIETEVLKQLLGDVADSAAGLATVFLEKAKEFDRLQRYITSIERAWYRALTILTKLQKERRAEEQAAALEQAWRARVAEESEQQPAEIKRRPNKSGSFRESAGVHRTGSAGALRVDPVEALREDA